MRDIRTPLADDAVLIIAHAIDDHWRDYGQPASTWPGRIQMELAYFERLITDARDGLCLDEAETFAMGFSGGGSFSGVLGCHRTDIRAFAAGGAVTYYDPASCVNTPAAWVTIGLGELEPPREDFRDFWRDRASCSPTSAATDPSPCVAYDGCDIDAPVHYCEHPDGHVWPSFGSQAMWDFFSTFVEE